MLGSFLVNLRPFGAKLGGNTMKPDRIVKLLFPLYSAELKCNEFETELEDKLGIKYSWSDCNRCGSKAFYIRNATATKNIKKLLKEDFEIPTLIDLEFVCAECGSCEFGLIQSESLMKLTRPKNRGQ